MAGTGDAEVFRRFYGETWNSGNLGVIEEVLDEGFWNHELAGFAGSHREAFTRAVVETRTAFPDWTTDIENVISESEKVVARWRSSGTHTGALAGLQPTGAPVHTRGITIVRIVGGRITDFWKQDDSHTKWRQLGTAPGPP
jgi:predicted ester cyclase